VKLGVPGTTPADSWLSSTNGLKPPAAVFDEASPSFLAAGAGIGGVSSGSGSLKMTIFDLELESAAILLERPGCLSFEPAIVFTSGMFSFILVLRVPRSFHSFVTAPSDASDPVGSTNIWIRLLEEDDGMRGVDSEVVLDEGWRDEDAGVEDSATMPSAWRG